MSEQKQRVYDALNKLGIKYEVVEHEPVHTMEDMDRLGLPEKGTLCKNLFLRDAKGKRHFLITCDENAKVDLKSLGRQLGAGNLSFASEERLEKYLGLKQGSVSPFGLMNDTDHAVEFFIDKNLSKCKSLGIHPLENTATVFLSFKDLDSTFQIEVDGMESAAHLRTHKNVRTGKVAIFPDEAKPWTPCVSGHKASVNEICQASADPEFSIQE